MHKLCRFFLLLCLALPIEAQRRSPKPTGAPGADLDILQTAVATFDGTLRSLDRKRLLIEMGEEQTVTIEVNKKTLYFRGKKAIPASDINPGTVVTVEAKKVANQLVAVAVRVREPQSKRVKTDTLEAKGLFSYARTRQHIGRSVVYRGGGHWQHHRAAVCSGFGGTYAPEDRASDAGGAAKARGARAGDDGQGT